MGTCLVEQIRNCLGKRCRLKRKTICSIIANINAVLLGLKPAFLLDQFQCSAETFVKLVMLVFEKQCSEIKLESFKILLFENNELFFINVEVCIFNVENHLKKIICLNHVESLVPNFDNLMQVVVNISDTLKKPESYFHSSENVRSKILLLYESILLALKQFSSAKDSARHQIVQIQQYAMPTSNNLCSVYGILLNYPFVYWFDQSKSEEACINMTELCVVKLLIPKGKYCDRKLLHEIYSFSFPKILSNSFNCVLQKWKKDAKEKVKHVFNSDDSCAIEELCVTVPCLSF